MRPKKITDCTNLEARKHFLKEECYYNFDLPNYFEFGNLIKKVSKKIGSKSLSDFYSNGSNATSKKTGKPVKPFNLEDVNYRFLNNRDGKFAWRPFQLIHPALYVSLVNKITEKNNWKLIVNRFKEFEGNSRIRCSSIPLKSLGKLSDKAAGINNWWQKNEQQAIVLALDYEYVLHTDISDCYGSIYTHTIVWALHSKEVGKKERHNKSLVGNIIDWHLQDMSFGQTNGIPQGSVLMDFIAEIVLGYTDFKLTERLKNESVKDYQIIRFRDDYRVFSNNPQDAELIIKHLTEILIGLGMRLNAQKTIVSNNIVRDSIKPDKLYWITQIKSSKSLQSTLLNIHELSHRYPNSGSLTKALTKFYNRIHKVRKTKENVRVLISIAVDIAYKNPRTYPIVAALLSKLLSLIRNEKSQVRILKSIKKRFNKIPNTGHIQIWLQRVTIKINKKEQYEELLCKKANDSTIPLWNSDWLSMDLRNVINSEPVINKNTIKKVNKIIALKEVQLFDSKSDYNRYD